MLRVIRKARRKDFFVLDQNWSLTIESRSANEGCLVGYSNRVWLKEPENLKPGVQLLCDW